MSSEALATATDFKAATIENTEVDKLTFNDISSGYHITGSANSLISILSSVAPVIRSIYFVDRDYAGNLVNAINNLPSGCVLVLGYGPYTIPNGTAPFEKSNYAIRGTRMPALGADVTSLVNGSIIRGTLVLSGDNIDLSDFGVDRGITVSNSLGATGDALVVHDANLAAVRYNISVRNVWGLSRGPYHAVLLEGLEKCTFENIWGYGGNWGVVFKTNKSSAVNIHAGHNVQGGITYKSDSYASCDDNVGTNFEYIDTVGVQNGGVFIYAATASMRNLTLSNIKVSGGNQGIKLVCDARLPGTYLLRNVTISNAVITGATNYGVETYGSIRNVAFNNIVVQDTISHTHFKVQEDAYSTTLSNINCDSSTYNAQAIYLGGCFSASNIRALVKDFFTNPSGIYIDTGANTSKFTLGTYTGVLNLNLIDGSTNYPINLLNDWTSYQDNKVSLIYNNGEMKFKGVLAPSGSWNADKLTILTVPTHIKPTTSASTIYMTALARFNTVEVVPVVLTLNVSTGALQFPNLLDANQFVTNPTAPTFIDLNNAGYVLKNTTY